MEVASFIGDVMAQGNTLAITGVGFDTYAIALEFCRLQYNPTIKPFQIILGLKPDESKLLYERGLYFHEKNPDQFPMIYNLNNESNISEREDLYRRRGIFIITSRILVGDLLSLALPPGVISSICVLNAHRCTFDSNHNEPFVLQIVHRENPSCRISSLSDRPSAFTKRLSASMLKLQAHTVRLFPRFHRQVNYLLSKFDNVEMEEVGIEVPPLLQKISEHYQQLLQGGIAEISKYRFAVGSQILTTPNIPGGDMVGGGGESLRRLVSSSTPSISTKGDIDVVDLFDVSMEEMGAIGGGPFGFLEQGSGMDLKSERPKKLAAEIRQLRLFWKSSFKQETVRTWEVLLSIRRNPEWSEEWLSSLAGRELLQVAKDAVFQIKSKAQDRIFDEEVFSEDDENDEEEEEMQIAHESGTKPKKKRFKRGGKIKSSNSPASFKLVPTHFMPPKYPEVFKLMRTFVPAPENLSLNTGEDDNRVRILVSVQDEYGAAVLRRLLLFGIENSSQSSYRRLICDLVDSQIVSNSNATASNNNDINTASTNNIANNNAGKASKTSQFTKIEFELLKKEKKSLLSQSYPTYSLESDRLFSPRELGFALQQQRTSEEIAQRDPQLPELELFFSVGLTGDTLHAHARRVQPHLVVLTDPVLAIMRACELYAVDCMMMRKREDFNDKSTIPPQPTICTFRYSNGPDLKEFAVSTHAEFAAWQAIALGVKGLVLRVDESSLIDSETLHRISSINNGDGKVGWGSRNILQRDSDKGVSSRCAGGGNIGASIMRRASIVVDVRELNAALPCMLYRAGIQVLPTTLRIGDYVLSPNICVERKSVPDLMQSLPSGRLLSQAVRMQKHYTTVFLLIELDATHLIISSVGSRLGSRLMGNMSSGGFGKGGLDIKSTLSLLVLFTLHCPAVRIIWSLSSCHSVQQLVGIKDGKDEPDVNTAAMMGQQQQQQQAAAATSTGVAMDEPIDEADRAKRLKSADEQVVGQGEKASMFASSEEEEYFREIARDLLRSIPGVTIRAAMALERRGGSLKDLSGMSVEELTLATGNNKVAAQAIWNFFNEGISVGQL